MMVEGNKRQSTPKLPDAPRVQESGYIWKDVCRCRSSASVHLVRPLDSVDTLVRASYNQAIGPSSSRSESDRLVTATTSSEVPSIIYGRTRRSASEIKLVTSATPSVYCCSSRYFYAHQYLDIDIAFERPASATGTGAISGILRSRRCVTFTPPVPCSKSFNSSNLDVLFCCIGS